MKLRALVIDEEARKTVRRVVEFAEAEAHWYEPYQGDFSAPGDDSRHVAMLGTYRCVFSITLAPDGQLYRHLSVSVPGEDFPNPYALYTIAELFGFTGWDQSNDPPQSWILRV